MEIPGANRKRLCRRAVRLLVLTTRIGYRVAIAATALPTTLTAQMEVDSQQSQVVDSLGDKEGSLFGLVIALASLVAIDRWRRIDADAKRSVQEPQKHADEVKQRSEEVADLVEEIKRRRVEADENLRVIRGLNAKAAADYPIQAFDGVKDNPSASPTDKARAHAILLERRGEIRGARELWRAIALVERGNDDKLAATA